MTYATKQLTEALQELVRNERPYKSKTVAFVIQRSQTEHFNFSREIEAFLDAKRDYVKRTRNANFGSY